MSGQIQMTGSTCSDPVPFQSTDLQWAGTITFGADMTYSSAMGMSGSMTLTYSARCLTFNGVTLTCDQLNQAAALDADGGVRALHCTQAGDGCSCTTALQFTPQTVRGTYQTQGTSLTMSGNGTTQPLGYCVQGDQLTWIQDASVSDAGVQATSSGSVVLEKQ